MTYDLSAIMRRAWEIVKAGRNWQKHFATRMKYALRDAWAEAKRAVTVKSAAQRLHEEIVVLESKAIHTPADTARLAELRRMSAGLSVDAVEAKRDLIASAKGRICAVTFTKKDGSERTMKVQPAALKQHVKGDAATEAGRKATATRTARHPHLLPVWDAEAKAPRSVNLATVSRIAVNGQVHSFA